MRKSALLAIASWILGGALAAAGAAPAQGPEEVSLDAEAPGPAQDQRLRQAAPPAQDGKPGDDSELDDERARLRDELLRDRAADFKSRSIQASAGESERMRIGIQEANRKRAEERGRVLLAERGESSGEATEEAKEVSRWAREEQLTDQERARRAAQGGSLAGRRQGYNSMVNGMQAWASGKDVSQARKEQRQMNKKDGGGDQGGQ